MKTFKQILGWCGLVLALCLGGALTADGSGITGLPAHPIFQTVTAVDNSGTTAIEALNGSAYIGIVAANSTVQQLLSSGSLELLANAGNCVIVSHAGTFLPCTNSGGAGNYVFSANAAQTVQSGQIYAFNVTNNGTTCATASGSPGLPTGWSLARSAAGQCSFTHPSVSAAASLIVTAIASAAVEFCEQSSGATATNFKIACYTTAGSATDANMMVMIQDWN